MAANAKITLVYFDIKGRAETTRLLLSAAGKEFEDKRVSGPSWEEYKPNAPYGQLPVLEVDGKRYAQSHAFNRYLADELGLGGKSTLESLRIDTVVGLWEDVLQKCVKAFFEKDEAKKAECTKAAKEAGTKVDGYLEAMLKETGTGYFVGDRLTLADIYVLDLHSGTMGDLLEPLSDVCPLLKANIEKSKANAGVAKYMASRK